jgi:mannose-6-phosphate isomerase-like protein (cupin superfamily)
VKEEAMQLFNLREHYSEKYQEFILGSAATGRHSVYLVYGELAKDASKAMAPDGHDEILLLLSGAAILEDGQQRITLQPEQAVAINPEESLTFTALEDCRYLVAGTHTSAHANHHPS